jgi:hypothetical protein
VASLLLEGQSTVVQAAKPIGSASGGIVFTLFSAADGQLDALHVHRIVCQVYLDMYRRSVL